MTSTAELYKKYRPKNFKQVLGQPDAIRMLTAMAKKKVFPHALLFTGASGCGKTTLARIVKEKLNCGASDFTELDAASNRGIEMVRSIQKRMSLAPINGDCRIWLIDECHALTSDAQGAFLKILEDTPEHVYFMLATTDPQKLKATIKTRCTEIAVKALSVKVMRELIAYVSKKEKIKLEDEVVDRLIEYADGSARKALVIMNTIFGIEETEDQMEAIAASDVKTAAIALAKLLINKRSQWPEVAKVLKELEDAPEGLRRMVLGYARGVLLGGKANAPFAYTIIDAFRDPFFDSGKAGLAAACWEVKKGV